MKTRRSKGESFVLLTKKEFRALALCVQEHAGCLGEDTIGALMRTAPRWGSDKAMVLLAETLDKATESS